MFPPKNAGKVREYTRGRREAAAAERPLLYFAIRMKGRCAPAGCAHVRGDDGKGPRYGLERKFSQAHMRGSAPGSPPKPQESRRCVHKTSTHDANNPRKRNAHAGDGMKYRYSYEELRQPKNIPAAFRMYRLNFDVRENTACKKYRDKYPAHFIERIPD